MCKHNVQLSTGKILGCACVSYVSNVFNVIAEMRQWHHVSLPSLHAKVLRHPELAGNLMDVVGVEGPGQHVLTVYDCALYDIDSPKSVVVKGVGKVCASMWTCQFLTLLHLCVQNTQQIF